MTWARYDDGWTDRQDLADLSYSTRWHLMALVGYCSRTHRYDGTLRAADARRASDVPDPDAAVAELVAAGHLEQLDTGQLRVVHIDEHVPPPGMRDEHRKAGQRERKRRQRQRPSTTTVTEDVTGDVTRDPGTGRDRTGQDREEHSATRSSSYASSQPPDPSEDPWPTVGATGLDTWKRSGKPLQDATTRDR